MMEHVLDATTNSVWLRVAVKLVQRLVTRATVGRNGWAATLAMYELWHRLRVPRGYVHSVVGSAACLRAARLTSGVRNALPDSQATTQLSALRWQP